ncbi:EF-P lysine aminoacylase EpmA [Pelovirga terrestris]|uniref:EF-P lysine aminoacylase GenX n=1 Tax=Pelovirga terrestris TaxID=2771352 RepID=A0A8J6UQV8_9BACT|nr:EF-P lysine aminoacylase GenX [Pelovirga terrestris]
MEPNWQLARKRSTIEHRARILHQIRAFFIDRGFIEVETPARIPVNAPELHIDAILSDGWYLQTSPELCMKRLLAAGYDNIFQICHCWRAEERGPRHLPEYTMLEWYRRNCDYHQLMHDCEGLIHHLVGHKTFIWQEQEIDISTPWPRITVEQAFSQHSSTLLSQITGEKKFSELISNEIEPALPRNKPLFLTDYPAIQGSLARPKSDDSGCVERVELYIAGLELANGFTELTDATEQRRRFEKEEKQRQSTGKTPCPLPEKYLEELGALTNAAGIALGVDRLIMLLCNKPTIDEVVCFTPEQL